MYPNPFYFTSQLNEEATETERCGLHAQKCARSADLDCFAVVETAAAVSQGLCHRYIFSVTQTLAAVGTAGSRLCRDLVQVSSEASWCCSLTPREKLLVGRPHWPELHSS